VNQQSISTVPLFARSTLILALCTLVACTSDRGAKPRGVAGTAEVIEVEKPQWRAGREWTVGAQPTVQIGSETREYQFAGIQGAVRLSGGQIAVADAGSNQVRIYDSQGRFISATGRAGGGPGEFRMIAKMVPGSGDSLVVFDPGASRVSVLGPSGTLGRTIMPTAASLGAELAGVLENGSMVFGVPGVLPPRDGLSRDSMTYVLVRPDGTGADTLTVAPGGQRFQRVAGGSVTRMTNPFGPRAAAAARGNRIALGATDSYEIREFGSDGAATRLLRRKVEAAPFTDADFRQVADQLPQMASALAEIPRPDHNPVFAALLIDREHNLWIEDFPAPGAPSVAWTVFDRKGAMLGQVTLPAAFRPTDIGGDYVLGVWADELGVERVRMYPLQKP
jgi:hypothetical protein